MSGEAKELWLNMLSVLETEISVISYDVWIKTLEVVDIVDGKLVVMAQNDEHRNFVATRYLELIRKVMKTINPLLSDVVVIEPSERRNTYATRRRPRSRKRCRR